MITDTPPPSVCGNWVVSRYMIHGMSAAPKGKFLGVRASYLPSRAQFGSWVDVKRPRYKVGRLADWEFFHGYHSAMSDLGIKGKSAEVVDVLGHNEETVDDPGSELYVRNGNEIITYWDGVFYLLDRRGLPCGEKYPKAPVAALPPSHVEDAIHDVSAGLKVPVSQVRFAVLIDVAYFVSDSRFLGSTLLKTINAGGPVTERVFTELAGRAPRLNQKLHDRLVQDYYLYRDNER